MLDAYFSGTKIEMAARRGAGRAGAANGEARLRHHRLAVWNLTGGAHCDRRVQRLAHAAVQHPPQRVGRRAAGSQPSIFHVRYSPEVRPSSGAVRCVLIGAAIRYRRQRGRPAGRPFGQACHSPGYGQNTYGTGCFLLANTGGR